MKSTELAQLESEDPGFADDKPTLMLVHFEFEGHGRDKINIPVCGETRKDKFTTNRFDLFLNAMKGNGKHVACRDCLTVLTKLSRKRNLSHVSACECVRLFNRGPHKNRNVGNKGLVPVPDAKGNFPIETCCDMEDLVPLAEQVFGTNSMTFWRTIKRQGEGCKNLLERVRDIPKDIELLEVDTQSTR